MALTTPDRSAGQGGHVGDHNDIVHAVQALQGVVGDGSTLVTTTGGVISDAVVPPVVARRGDVFISVDFMPGIHAPAVGDGTTDDSAAWQAALDALPANGGTVVGRKTYRISTALTSSRPGLVVRGMGGQLWNEGETSSAGTTLLVDAGVNGLVYNGTGSSLMHRGPKFFDINFREAGAGKTSTLLKISNAVRWEARGCSFRGGAYGIYADATNTTGGDVSWATVDHCSFSLNDKALSFPRGTGRSTVVACEFTNNTTYGVEVLPANSLGGQVTVVSCKFDVNGAGVFSKGNHTVVLGCGFEQNTIGVDLARDAALHADSGKANVVAFSLITGSGTQTGIRVGSGCADTQLIYNTYSNLGTLVNDSGTTSTRWDGASNVMDRASGGVFQSLKIGGTSTYQVKAGGSAVVQHEMLVANGILRFILGGTSSGEQWQVQDSGGNNLLRVLATGVVEQSKAAGSWIIKGALDHDGTTVGFYGTTPATKPTVSGTRADAAALASLLSALAGLGLITDTSTAGSAGGGTASPAVAVATSQVSLSNSSAESAVGTYTVAGGTVAAGTSYRLTASGTTDNIATSGAFTIRVRIGGVTGPTVAVFAFNTQASAQANKQWSLNATMTFRSSGATAAVAGGGICAGGLGAAVAVVPANLAPGTTVDTTAAKDLVLTGQWATADAGNVMRVDTFVVELVKA